jgi:hypothetical protein
VRRLFALAAEETLGCEASEWQKGNAELRLGVAGRKPGATKAKLRRRTPRLCSRKVPGLPGVNLPSWFAPHEKLEVLTLIPIHSTLIHGRNADA